MATEPQTIHLCQRQESQEHPPPPFHSRGACLRGTSVLNGAVTQYWLAPQVFPLGRVGSSLSSYFFSLFFPLALTLSRWIEECLQKLGCDENKMGLCLMWHRQWLYSRWSTHTSCTQRFHLTCQIRVNYQGIESVWQWQLLKMHSRAYNAASKWIYSWKGQNSLKTFEQYLTTCWVALFYPKCIFSLFFRM